MADSAPNIPQGKIHPEQLHWTIGFTAIVSGFTTGTSATSDVVTTALTNALVNLGRGGNNLPLQVSTNDDTQGVMTGVLLPMQDINGNPITVESGGDNYEVYGKITEAAGVYTLSYYINVSGTETAATLDGVDISFGLAYCAYHYLVPKEGLIGNSFRVVAQDPSGGGGTFVDQVVSVTALNTLANLSAVPKIGTKVALLVNGVEADELSGGKFTRSGAALTWVPANGHPLYTTMRVVARYQIL